MFGLFRGNPVKKLEKEITAKRERAVTLQRSGDLRAYAELIAEVESLEERLISMLGDNAS